MNAVGWFEIYVQDMARARAFYETVFDTKLEPLKTPDTMQSSGMEMWQFPGDMQNYGANGVLCRAEGVPSGSAGIVIYFGCEDCAVLAQRVEAAGGKVHRPKTSIGEYGFFVHVLDTEGNMIGLHSMT